MQIHEKLVNGKCKKAKRKKVWYRCFYWPLPKREQFIHSDNERRIRAIKWSTTYRVPSWVLSALHEIQCVSRAIDTVIQLQCVCEISGCNAQENHYKKRGVLKCADIAIMWINDEQWIPRLLDFHACEFKCAELFNVFFLNIYLNISVWKTL